MITPLKKTLLFTCFSLIIAQARADYDRAFTPPDAPFIQSVKEVNKRLVLPAGLVDQAQKVIDAARAAQPAAFLILEPNGPLVVGANPLRLGSRMSLMLTPTAGIIAGPSATARSLVLIEKAELVSISSTGPGPAPLQGGGVSGARSGYDQRRMGLPASIQGGGVVAVGILIKESGRINLDQLAISGCSSVGIFLTGRDAAVVNEACSLTRSFIIDNNDGVRVDQSGAFMCLDNQFENNKGTALLIKSLCSVVAGNSFCGNNAAIISGSDRGVITRNIIDDTQPLTLTAESTGVLVSENRTSATGQRVAIDGKNQQFFNNSFNGSVILAPSCGEVFLVGNPGLLVPSTAANLTVFNPPTAMNPHKNPLIVPGKERFDLSVPGGAVQVTESVDAVTGKKKTNKKKAVPVDLVTVQAALDQARAAHPNAVLVLKLDGEYISRDPNGLKLPPYTCVLLQGRILANLNAELEPNYVKEAPLSQVVAMPSSGVASISGGTLDGGRQAFFPVNAAGAGLVVIDCVQLTQGARDGVFTRGHGDKAPVFVYHCGITSNYGRGVWSHVATRVHSIDNVIVGNGMDGIDLDAHSKDGTALYNVSSGNRRHGVFLEEAINHHIVFGNNLMGNGFSGVHVWNQEIKGNTGFNVVAANRCTANVRGITVGGREDEITANGNFFFNNVCRQNRSDGFRSGNGRGTDSYFSQCVLGGNVESDINDPESAKATIFNAVPGPGR